MKPLTQKGATDLGYSLLKGAPLSDEARGYVESSLPYIIQRFYLAGCILYAPDKEAEAGFKPNLTAGDIQRMKEEGVAY